MDIFTLLKTDHKKVAELFSKIEKTAERNSEKRQALFDVLYDSLKAHSEAEQEAVYFPLQDRKITHDIILEGYEEHDLITHLLDQISQLQPDEESWLPKVCVLKEIVEHHVKEEEDELFKKMKKECDEEELKEMAMNMKSAKTNKTEQTKQPIDHASVW